MLKIKKKKKYIKIILGAVAVCSCFFGVGLLQQTEQERNVNISAYEQFDGNVYDPQRLEPIDMMQLQIKWKNQVMADAADTDSFLGARTVSNASAKESVPGWVTRYGIGKREVRYYTDDRHFVIGWQYLQKDGLWDWYYFAEDTGYLLSDTVIDGVVLSRDGYAISVSATTEETLQAAGLAAHCEEVVVQNTILVTEEIAYTKDMKLIGGTENPVSIKGTAMEENVLSVLEQAVLTVASNVEISTNGNAQNAIHVQEQAQVHCYGTVGDLDESTAQCGILASGEDTVVF
ncbi:MAG: hypothetical protein IJ471_06490, partial [Eubacterium sp.]|nr:hypothetical protein [Eubacterium sp.]